MKAIRYEARRWQVVSIGLALAGLVDSLYLSWIKLTGNTAACSGIGDCEAVNTSRFSEIGGIPVALLGAFGYVLIIGMLVLRTRKQAWDEPLSIALFGVTLVGTLYSIYLTYLEVVVIRAVCPFCVVSAMLMAFLFILSIVHLREIDYSG